MQKINLLYVITRLELGGAQKQLLSLIRSLDKTRYNIFLFTGWKGMLLSEALSIDGLSVKASKHLVHQINPVKDLLALIEIRRFIGKNNIEIVHTHSSKAGIIGRFAARLAKAKIILHTVHGWPFHDYQPQPIKKLFIWMERIAERVTDKLIVVSLNDRQKGLENNIGKDNKYQLIRHGIEYAQFNVRDEAMRKELGIDSDELAVGMVACFKPQKSPQDFIRLAFLVKQSLSRIKFILVGDGILRGKLEKLIRSLNLHRHVILTGWRWDIPRILSAIDVFVLTSLWEGMPISVLEAMASSKSIVATNTGGIAEIISEGKTGFLSSPRDIKRMSEKLTILLEDDNLRRQIGKNARESLGLAFSIPNMVKNHNALYEDLIIRKS